MTTITQVLRGAQHPLGPIILKYQRWWQKSDRSYKILSTDYIKLKCLRSVRRVIILAGMGLLENVLTKVTTLSFSSLWLPILYVETEATATIYCVQQGIHFISFP